MNTINTDVCIIGAGPAGSTTSLFLSKYGIKSVIVEKESFPKNKVCGEGTRGQVENVLKRLSPDLVNKFNKISNTLDNLRITAGSGFSLKVSFSEQKVPQIKTLRRIAFDQFLIDEAKQKSNIQVLENTYINDFQRISEDKVITTDKNKNIQIVSKMIVLATGNENVYKDTTFFKPLPKPIQLLGLRCHLSNVYIPKERSMELFLPKKFHGAWMFITYLPDNYVNVLSVIRKDKVKKGSVIFKDIYNRLFAKFVEGRKEFTHAIKEGTIKGTTINLYGKNKSFSGDNYLLVGDAATSSNPILGFGIGHAMYSGMLGANMIKEAFELNSFSGKTLKSYDKIWWKKLGGEHKLGKIVYYLLDFPRIIEFIMRSKFLIDTFSSNRIEKDFLNPLFYFKKIFSKQ